MWTCGAGGRVKETRFGGFELPYKMFTLECVFRFPNRTSHEKCWNRDGQSPASTGVNWGRRGLETRRFHQKAEKTLKLKESGTMLLYLCFKPQVGYKPSGVHESGFNPSRLLIRRVNLPWTKGKPPKFSTLEFFLGIHYRCSGKGVQRMRVVSYNKTAYDIM